MRRTGYLGLGPLGVSFLAGATPPPPLARWQMDPVPAPKPKGCRSAGCRTFARCMCGCKRCDVECVRARCEGTVNGERCMRRVHHEGPCVLPPMAYVPPQESEPGAVHS